MSSRDSESRPSIPDLIQKCQDLCGNVGSASRDFPADKESFLRGSLGDALQQLELILRVLEGESRTASREESQGLLRRIFAKKQDADADDVETLGSPRQGLQGNSWTISLSELLGFLAFGRKTGVLWVDTLEENYMLVLEEGRLLHATSDSTPAGLRLGEILVGFGFLTRRQLERFLANRDGGQKLIAGEDLIDTGIISEDELLSALTYQVQQLFYRLVSTKNAVFRFREGMEIMLAYKVSLDINQLLLQTAAAQDESEEQASRNSVLESLGEEDAEAAAPAEERASASEPRPDAQPAGSSQGAPAEKGEKRPAPQAGDGKQADRKPGGDKPEARGTGQATKRRRRRKS